MPILDYLQFESGDSSYNVWIFTLQHALSFLGRLVCDLYLRMNVSPKSKTPCKRRKSETSLAEIFGSKFEFLLPFARRRQETQDGGWTANIQRDCQCDSEHACFEDWEIQMRPVSQ